MADKIDHVEIKGTTYDVPGADGSVSSVNGQTGTVVLDANDVGALPDNTSIPSKTSDLTNDSGFITSETDPTVPSWAKASTKPTYTAQEVGALPSSTSIPSKTSDLTNDSGFISTETDPTVPSWAKASSKPTYTASEVGALPANTAIPSKTSDLTNDSGFITGYTETDPVYSASAASGITSSDITNWDGKADASDIPTNTSDLNNDSGFITSSDIPVTSVNAITGDVVLGASDVGALPDDTVIPTNTSDLTNDSGFITSSSLTSYLPKSAGSSNALTGNLYRNAGAAEVYDVYQYNGTTRGQIYTNGSTGSYPCFNIASYNGSTQKAKIVLDSNSGYTIVGGNALYLRPTSADSTTGQIHINSSGTVNVTGVYNAENKSATFSAVNISAGGNVLCATVTGLTANHTYLLVATGVRVYDLGSSAGYVYLNFYRGNKAEVINYQYHAFQKTNIYVHGATTFTANSTYTSCTLYVESSAAAKATGTLEVWRIK